MKGLVLSGGYGTRLRPITYTQAKQLVPVANKPVLFYGLEALSEAGIKEVGIVVGDTHREIEEAVGDGSRFGLKVTYIHQEKPLGLAHAVKISRYFLDGENFVMYLGDNILKASLSPFIERFESSGADALILVAEVEHPERFGVVELKDGKVVRLVEKPKQPPSNLALVGVYFFTPTIFSAVEAIKPSWRGELEITDAIQWLVDNGHTVECEKVEGWWKDTGKLEDLLEANRLILDDIERRIEAEILDSKIEGRVGVGRGTVIENSIVRGPCIIGQNCRISSCYIGPYTSIQDGVELKNIEMENSIVLRGAKIKNIQGRIHTSLIGRDVQITRREGKPSGITLMLGDRSKIEL